MKRQIIVSLIVLLVLVFIVGVSAVIYSLMTREERKQVLNEKREYIIAQALNELEIETEEECALIKVYEEYVEWQNSTYEYYTLSVNGKTYSITYKVSDGSVDVESEL